MHNALQIRCEGLGLFVAHEHALAEPPLHVVAHEQVAKGPEAADDVAGRRAARPERGGELVHRVVHDAGRHGRRLDGCGPAEDEVLDGAGITRRVVGRHNGTHGMPHEDEFPVRLAGGGVVRSAPLLQALDEEIDGFVVARRCIRQRSPREPGASPVDGSDAADARVRGQRAEVAPEDARAAHKAVYEHNILGPGRSASHGDAMDRVIYSRRHWRVLDDVLAPGQV
mmetsp:Transcript_19918/g.67423  ORF Transcript_19918/g.67423 Transcript_19918/m.67423 type:complete len:226 (-) Transcript_19918:180-857(-)